jgi:hypothetical protein
VTRRFDHFVAIDWSGAIGARQPGIAVASCAIGDAAPVLVREGHIWSRDEVFAWLLEDAPSRALIGMDLGPALPFADRASYFPGWDESPANARALWQMVDEICEGEPNFGANRFVDHPEASRHFRRHGGRQGDLFPPGRGRLRVTDEEQAAMGLSPCSNFNLIGAQQVGKSSLTGMRVLHRLGGRIPVWPFDPLPEEGTVIVEIYTSLAAVAAGRSKSRAKIRDGTALDVALDNLGSTPHRELPRYTDHATDALVTAAWLRAVHQQSNLWSPAALEPVRHTEGWTFGVP